MDERDAMLTLVNYVSSGLREDWAMHRDLTVCVACENAGGDDSEEGRDEHAQLVQLGGAIKVLVKKYGFAPVEGGEK